MDAEAAKHYVFGGLCASGWHTCAGWMKTFMAYWTAEVARLEAAGLAAPKLGPSAGFKSLQWLKPVYAGETITFKRTVLAHRPLASRPGWRLVSVRAEAFDSTGDKVIEFESAVLLKAR